MAHLKQAKTEAEIKKLTVSNVKNEYNKLASDYNKILEGQYVYCHHCNDFLSRDSFYSDKGYASSLFPICKKCLLAIVEQREKSTDKPNETKESVKKVLMMMDLPYIDDLYESCMKSVNDEVNEKNRKSPFLQMITILKSLPQYRGLKWKDSDTEIENDESSSNRKVKQGTIKRFGNGFSNDDYLFLQDQYDDWTGRYECKTKAQEELFERLCFKKLEIFKATKEGKSTKDLDRSYQDLMATANITPKQNSLDALSEAQTLGTLIQKWEEERPLPEIDPELEDVDKIGLYIDVFFKGHMSKMLNLKNPLVNIYENFMRKLAVTKPEYDEDEASEELFNKIFGSVDGDV